MNKLLIIIVTLFFTTSLLLQAEVVKSKNKKNTLPEKKSSIREEMNLISQKIRDLGPIIASELEFTKVQNKETLTKALTELQSRFKNLKKHPVIELQGLSINQLIMSEQLGDVVHLVEKGKAIQGRAKLLSTLNLCVSCHSQSPGIKESKLFSDQDITNFKISNFEKAELYFITRDYEKANKLYSEFLDSSKKTDDDEMIYKALERELIYFVKIKKDFIAGKAYFEKFTAQKKFSDSVMHEITDWVKMLSGKSLWENFDATKVSEDDMQKFLKQFISDDEEGPIFTETDSSEVYDLNLSSILLDYYNAHPDTKIGGKILYWLAMIDKRVNDDFFFSIGDFYLLSCMEKYSKDPIAQECYESYVEDMEINLIAQKKELNERLKRLKKLINYKEVDE